MADLPSKLLVGGLLRAAEAVGGNGAVLASGNPDRGALLVILTTRGAHPVVLERVSSLSGGYSWSRRKSSDSDDEETVARFVAKKKRSDADLWLVELDIADAEQFIVDSLPHS